MGDPGGIGPEIILKSLSTLSTKTNISFLIIGAEQIFCQTAQDLKIDFPFRKIVRLDEALEGQPGVYFFQPAGVKPQGYKIGQVDPANGQAALTFIRSAGELALTGRINALVTGPVSKQAIVQSGYRFTGHTEFLAKQARTRKVVMMFVTERLRVALVTTHLSYRKVPLHLNTENIINSITITAEALNRDFGLSTPRLAVCGLNPHSGEGGFLGREEKEIIQPALAEVKKQGINCRGPFPADTIFFRAWQGEFDAVIALYHDQGLIPIKTLAGHKGTNITLGLPFVRASVIHGTAFDIAGKGIADADSMKYAIQLSCQIVSSRTELF